MLRGIAARGVSKLGTFLQKIHKFTWLDGFSTSHINLPKNLVVGTDFT